MTDPSLPDDLQRSLPDHLVLQRELGGGGMSRVYLARDNTLGRDVVVKVLSPQLAGELSAERFTREIRMAATLQQANIVPLLTAGVAGEVPYFTMPFVDGESLRHRLRDGARPSMSEAVDILRDVARALSYAHARGIVHRDIKPENILLSHGAAVVTDFGIAKAVSASRTMEYATGEDPSTLTRAGVSLGTPMYMAPEQITGSDLVDHRADMYAWACVAYELLTGTPPFVREHVSKVLAAHISETPRPLSSIASGVPASVASTVMQCLAKEPADRPSRMQDVITAMSTTGEALPPPPAKPSPWARVAGATAVLAVAAAAWWWSGARGGIAEGTPQAVTEVSPSLAVIPFVSVGGDTANVYLADGIADELTTVLSRVPGLRLAGRSTAARFKGSTLTAKQLGDTLDVRTILLGSLRRAGDRVRVTAELSDATDGRVLWQNTFEEDARDVFRMQEQLAQAIAGQLQLRLSATATDVGTTNPEAYDFYLRGMQVYRNRGPVFTDAERYFDEAIKRDSNFARAWAGKAISLSAIPYYVVRATGTVIGPAKLAAERALALDSTQADVHLALGGIATETYDWDVSRRELNRALEIDPGNAIVHFRLGFLEYNTGHLDAARKAFTKARDLDPLVGLYTTYVGSTMVLQGELEGGVREALRGYTLSPGVSSVRSLLLFALTAAGQDSLAGVYAREFVRFETDPLRLGALVQGLAAGGDRQQARALLERIEQLPDELRGVWLSRTQARGALGDYEGMLAAFEAGARGDGGLIPTMPLIGPWFDRIRSTPRFLAVLKRYHLENTPIVAGLPKRP